MIVPRRRPCIDSEPVSPIGPYRERLLVMSMLASGTQCHETVSNGSMEKVARCGHAPRPVSIVQALVYSCFGHRGMYYTEKTTSRHVPVALVLRSCAISPGRLRMCSFCIRIFLENQIYCGARKIGR